MTVSHSGPLTCRTPAHRPCSPALPGATARPRAPRNRRPHPRHLRVRHLLVQINHCTGVKAHYERQDDQPAGCFRDRPCGGLLGAGKCAFSSRMSRSISARVSGLTEAVSSAVPERFSSFFRSPITPPSPSWPERRPCFARQRRSAQHGPQARSSCSLAKEVGLRVLLRDRKRARGRLLPEQPRDHLRETAPHSSAQGEGSAGPARSW